MPNIVINRRVLDNGRLVIDPMSLGQPDFYWNPRNNASFNSGSIANNTGVNAWNRHSDLQTGWVQATGGNQPIYRAAGFGTKPSVEFVSTDTLRSTSTSRLNYIHNGDANGFTNYYLLKPDFDTPTTEMYLHNNMTSTSLVGHLCRFTRASATEYHFQFLIANGTAGTFLVQISTAEFGHNCYQYHNKKVVIALKYKYVADTTTPVLFLYINGVLIGSKANNLTGPSAADSATGTWFGARATSNTVPYFGHFGDIIFYNAYHTDTQIKGITNYLTDNN